MAIIKFKKTKQKVEQKGNVKKKSKKKRKCNHTTLTCSIVSMSNINRNKTINQFMDLNKNDDTTTWGWWEFKM